MSDKFNDILSEIKNTRSVLKVIVPSKQVEVELSPLTLAQQKLIIETTSDTTLGVLFFNNVFYKILKENIKGNISDYNTVDRVNLTLALRQHLKDVIGTDDNEITVTDLLERNKALTYSIEPTVITSGDFTFNVEAPSLDVDNFINTHLLNKYKNVTFDENNIKVLESIDSIHFIQVTEYINSIRDEEAKYTKYVDSEKSVDITPDLFIL